MSLSGLIILLAILFLFARWFLGVGVGAPFVPVRKRDIEDALALVGLTPEDVVVDLGSGDGRLLVAAAERGARVIGYELNPFLVWVSRRRLRRFGPRARVYQKDLRAADLDQATAVFIFGIESLMPTVAERVRRLRHPARVVSFAFPVPGFRPAVERGIVKLYAVGQPSAGSSFSSTSNAISASSTSSGMVSPRK